jgi:curved DNA-binding protein CbpA
MDTELLKIKIKNARQLLGLTQNKKYTFSEIKKHYRIAALKNHPDKHFNSDESTTKFKEINEAYVLLSNKCIDDNSNNGKNGNNGNSQYYEMGDDEDSDYKYNNLFSAFINSLMVDLSNAKITEVNIILTAVMDKCKILTAAMFDNIDRISILFIYDLIIKYYTILDISNERFDGIIKILKNKMKIDDVIILNPTISNLFEVNNIQIIEHEEKTYYIPNWHTELYYDINEQRELIVKCIPKLPEYIYIDELNNIYIDVRTRVENLFNLSKPVFTIVMYENISIDIPIGNIEFKTSQVITLHKRGIPMINTENVYDISERMDIIVNLEILL